MKRLHVAALLLPLASGCAGLGSDILVGPLYQEDEGQEEAGQREAYHEEGLYLGVYGQVSKFRGDIEKSPILIIAPNDFVTVPALDQGAGFEGRIGYRWGSHALEVGYGVSNYDADPLVPLFPSDADVQAITISFKKFYRVETNLQPYLVAGVVMSEMKLTAAAFDATTLAVKNADLDGIGVKLGGGLNFYVTPRIALTFEGSYTFGRYDEVGNFSGTQNITPPIDADVFAVSGGISFTL